MSTDVLLDIAVRTLITHSYSQRIKKLIFAAYQQAWENNAEVLGQFDLRALLISLRQRYLHLNELEYQFKRIVSGLKSTGALRRCGRYRVRDSTALVCSLHRQSSSSPRQLP